MNNFAVEQTLRLARRILTVGLQAEHIKQGGGVTYVFNRNTKLYAVAPAAFHLKPTEDIFSPYPEPDGVDDGWYEEWFDERWYGRNHSTFKSHPWYESARSINVDLYRLGSSFVESTKIDPQSPSFCYKFAVSIIGNTIAYMDHVQQHVKDKEEFMHETESFASSDTELRQEAEKLLDTFWES